MFMSYKNTLIIIISSVAILIIGGLFAWRYLGVVQPQKKPILEEKRENSTILEKKKERSIKIYFGKTGGRNCNAIYPLSRIVPQTENLDEMARIAIEELIKGPTKEEERQGYAFISFGEDIERHRRDMEEKGLNIGEFSKGVRIKKFKISHNVAYIDFNFVFGASGIYSYESCRISTFKSALINTLRQFFPEVRDVIISVEGKKWPLSFNELRKLEFERGRSNVFVETSQEGEDVSDLAERALNRYLKQVSYVEDIRLTKSQKIYTINYLRDKIKAGPPKVGNSIEFPADLIKEAISASRSASEVPPVAISLSGTSFAQGDKVIITYPRKFQTAEPILCNTSGGCYVIFIPDIKIEGDYVSFVWTISANEKPGSYYIELGEPGEKIKSPIFTISASDAVRPKIISVTPSVVSIGDKITIAGQNFDPLGGYPSIGWVTHTHIVVTITNSNGQERSILCGVGLQEDKTIKISSTKIEMIVPSFPCEETTIGGSIGGPGDEEVLITPGRYSLTIEVDGRGTSDPVEITIR